MIIPIQEFGFNTTNNAALIFFPGYTKAFKAPILAELISAYVSRGNVDVLGLDPDYVHDTMDDFHVSETNIHETIVAFHAQYPKKKLVLIAKSLSGALCLHDAHNLPIAGIVVLGSSLALGWPQRISILDQEGHPSYASECADFLSRISIPTHILSGGDDVLGDNTFLETIVASHTNIRVTIIPHAGHGLQDTTSKVPLTDICIPHIDEMIAHA